MQVEEEVWYIQISGGVEGPFSKRQMKRDDRLNFDTLVWKEGMAEWKAIRDVPELNDLFEESPPSDDDSETDDDHPLALDEEVALEYQVEPPTFIYWLLIALLISMSLAYNYYFRV